MATTNWCRGAARPCQPPSQCTLPPRAASSTAATAGAAAPEAERGEAAREAEEGCTRISARSWTIKPGYVNFSRRYSFKINALSIDLADIGRFSCHSVFRPIKVRSSQRRPARPWATSRAAALSAARIHRTRWWAMHKALSGRRGLWLWRTSWCIRKTRRWNLQQSANGSTTGSLLKVLWRLSHFYV